LFRRTSPAAPVKKENDDVTEMLLAYISARTGLSLYDLR
jgi:hypothetical protein